MYILEPLEHETIWGGEKLKIANSKAGKVGHLYMTYGHKDMANKIVNGKYSDMELSDVFKLEKADWGMAEYDEFPLTIALVDANENLSIQVHPNDTVAQALENEKIGKEESWIFLNAPTSGWIYAGCNCDAKEQVIDAVDQGNMEKITHKLPIKQGDYVCIKEGTLHAMTKGSFVYEIEYGGNYTYRFYDYNRIDQNGNKRELHIDKALKAINLNVVPEKQQVGLNKWIDALHYQILMLEDIVKYTNISKKLEILSVIQGNGEAENINIKMGTSILLLPGESITNIALKKCVIARLR